MWRLVRPATWQSCRVESLVANRYCIRSNSTLSTSSELTSELNICCDQIALSDIRRFLQRDLGAPILPSSFHRVVSLMSRHVVVDPRDLFDQHQLLLNVLLPWMAKSAQSLGGEDLFDQMLVRWIDTLCRTPNDSLCCAAESSFELGIAMHCALKVLRCHRLCELHAAGGPSRESTCLANDVTWLTQIKKVQRRLVALSNGAQRLLALHFDLSRVGGLTTTAVTSAKHANNAVAILSCNCCCMKLMPHVGVSQEKSAVSDFPERLSWLDGRDQFERMPEATLNSINRQLSSISCRNDK